MEWLPTRIYPDLRSLWLSFSKSEPGTSAYLASLRLSRIYRPMRTLDDARPASKEDTTTRFYDLLKHTAREGGEIDEDENREWTIEASSTVCSGQRGGVNV